MIKYSLAHSLNGVSNGADINLFFWPHGPRVRGGEKIILLFWPDGPWARKVPLLICMRFFGPWDSLNLTWACMGKNHSPLFVLMGLESESSPYTFAWEELDSSWGVFGDQFKEFFPFTPFICMVALETPYIYYSRPMFNGWLIVRALSYFIVRIFTF